MLINDAIGRLGVQRTRELSRSARPHAPAIPDREPRPGPLRTRTAGALRRLADRIGPADSGTGPVPVEFTFRIAPESGAP